MAHTVSNESTAQDGKDPLLAPCGLYCRFCSIRHADETGDTTLKEKLAGFFQCEPAQLTCRGCQSEERFFFCQQCGIRDCTTEKGLEGCYQCDEFPCGRVTEFPIAVGREIMLEVVPEWRRLGTRAWVEQELRNHACASCGEPMMRGFKYCVACGHRP